MGVVDAGKHPFPSPPHTHTTPCTVPVPAPMARAGLTVSGICSRPSATPIDAGTQLRHAVRLAGDG